MQAQVLNIRPLARIRRSHRLPVPGNVLVRPGQNVSSGDLLAEVDLPIAQVTVDVVRALGLSSPQEAEHLIQHKVGERLEEKDIIAETGGLFSRVIRTPAPGLILSIKDGSVLIETQTRHIALEARLPGLVTEIQKNQKIVIESNGTLIQGSWGNGKVGSGLLVNKSETRDSALTPANLGLDTRNTILVAGTCADEATLNQAAQAAIAGLILGSIPSRLIPAAEKQPYPILVTDGFGLMGINELAYQLLSTNEGRETSISAVLMDARKGIRPEIVIALPVEGQTFNDACEYTPGQTVRVNAYPYAGETGIIEKVSTANVLLPSGLRAPAAEVRINQVKKVIPLVNLEVISIESELSAETK